MAEVTKSYKERMREARAEARAKREAAKAEWHRRTELRYEIRNWCLMRSKLGSGRGG
jgi:hypothetical protein